MPILASTLIITEHWTGLIRTRELDARQLIPKRERRRDRKVLRTCLHQVLLQRPVWN